MLFLLQISQSSCLSFWDFQYQYDSPLLFTLFFSLFWLISLLLHLFHFLFVLIPRLLYFLLHFFLYFRLIVLSPLLLCVLPLLSLSFLPPPLHLVFLDLPPFSPPPQSPSPPSSSVFPSSTPPVFISSSPLPPLYRTPHSSLLFLLISFFLIIIIIITVLHLKSRYALNCEPTPRKLHLQTSATWCNDHVMHRSLQ